MSEAELIIHKRYRLFQMLSSKYSSIREEYYNLYLDCLLENKPSHFLIQYKEKVYFDNLVEYIRRDYKIDECRDRMPRLSDYYKNYLTFFCRPIFSDFKVAILMHHYGDNKAEMYYKNNYGSLNERQSSDQYESRNYSISSFDNKTNIKTIFNKTTRNCIDNNIITTMVFDKSNISRSIREDELYTKRSKNDSLRNILVSMKVIKPLNDRRSNNNKKKFSLSLKSSLCTLTKSKGTTNSTDFKKKMMNPKFHPLLPNYKASIVELKKIKHGTVSKNITPSIPKHSMINRQLSHKNSIVEPSINTKNQESKSLNKKQKKKFRLANLSQGNTNRNLSNQLPSQNSKSKSKNKTAANIIQRMSAKTCTYSNFILNSKKKKNIFKTQRSTTNTSKKCNVGSNPKINNNNNYNSNESVSTSNTNNIQSNPIVKNQFQLYMNYTDSISRNKKTVSYSTTSQSKNKTLQTANFIGVTTCKGTISIDERDTKRSQLKSILQEISKGSEHHTQRIAKKLDQLIKGSSTLELLKTKRPIYKDAFINNSNSNSHINIKKNHTKTSNIHLPKDNKTSSFKIQVKTRQPSLKNLKDQRKLSP